jgi:hypothetical protein
MDKPKLLKRLETAWQAFRDSYAGLTDGEMLVPGVTGRWSVRDIVAHVTTWEEEALKNLPLILEGVRPPRYSTKYGGIDAFNALMTKNKAALSLPEVREEAIDVHRRLVRYLERAPEDQLTGETRFRHRLRMDTYGHYPKHAQAIREWRAKGAVKSSPPLA